MAKKVLAMNVNGDLTFCTAEPEKRGKGRCNHIAHQRPDESATEFMERIDSLRQDVLNKNERNDPAASLDPDNDSIEDDSFIPLAGTEIELKPYRMTDEEKEDLVKIENRMQLDQNIEGGYIELESPLWNDMDKNYFAQMAGIHKNKITSVLHGESYIVTDSDDNRYPEGKIITKESYDGLMEQVNSGAKEKPNCSFGTGVEAMNYYADEKYNWHATEDIFVLPYYMRIGAMGKEIEDDETGEIVYSDPIDSDITVAYKYLLRNHSKPDQQQIAYEALLNNNGLDKDKARYSNKYRNKSLADQFAGKGGVFRACLSGSSIPYSARTVIIPEVMPYGYIKIPSSVAIDLYKPTLISQMVAEGKNVDEIEEWFHKFRKPQTEIADEDREELERRISSRRVIMNRQPSLHTSSLQSYRPLISGDATTHIHPLYCKAFGADFDGDTVTLYGINQDYIIPVVDKTIDAKNSVNIRQPRSQSSSAIMPDKDALFGLLNILAHRSDEK